MEEMLDGYGFSPNFTQLVMQCMIIISFPIKVIDMDVLSLKAKKG